MVKRQDVSTAKPLLIQVPETTKIALENNMVRVSGPKGELTQVVSKDILVTLEDGKIVITRKTDNKAAKALHGLTRALLQNAIAGVTEGFKKTLELSGVGYRAAVSGDELTLSVGFSHPVKFKAPGGITFAVAENKITLSGMDKHLVGQIAHTIRSVRPPEPYKGKGIKYEGEKIRRKAGKAAAKAAGGVK